MTTNCHMSALSISLPDTILTNNDLAQIVDTNNQWIIERTGIHSRRKINSSENASDLGLKAAQESLNHSDISASSLTHLIAATCTPDHLSPSVACIIAGQINASEIMAFDMQAACTGFIYGISVCRSIIQASPASKILLVCTEALTRKLNWQDRSTCVLFGDAATACIFSSTPQKNDFKIIDVLCQSDGRLKDLIIVGGGSSCQYQKDSLVDEKFFLSMQGRETYRHAVRQMVEVCKNILKRNNMTIEDIDLIVPHQANMRIIEAVGQRLKADPQKIFTNVAKYGNTSAASIPLALKEACDENYVKPNSTILVTAFGAGLTWGAALVKYS